LLQRFVPLPAAIVQTFLPAVVHCLRQEKQRQGWFDFDDMLALVWEGLHGPQSPALLATLRQRYRYALIDEFQDTDPIQWQIFRQLFLHSARSNILYVIGDPKQAIYAFRGADVYTYLEARQAIQHGRGKVIPLKQNYRSTQAMIDVYNILFAPDTAAPFFTGAIGYQTPVHCGDTSLRAVNAAGEALTPIHLLHLLPGATVLTAALVRGAFGRRMAQVLRQLLLSPHEAEAAAGLWLGRDEAWQAVRARDVFVLTRSAREGVEIAQYLRAEGVPYAFYKQEGLFQGPEAQEIYDVLVAIASPHETAKRLKAWMTPFFAVPLEDLPAGQDLPGTHPLMQRLLGWKELAESQDYASLFANLLHASGLVRRELFLKQSERELTNYLHILEILLEEARRSCSTLLELALTLKTFISGSRNPVGENANVQRLESERDAVQIMTIHKSKGLEAAVVFLYGGFGTAPDDGVAVYHEEGRRVMHLAPNAEAKTTARREQEEEEQRLLYVALTRARARLYLPYIEPSQYPERLQGGHRHLNARLAHVLTDAAHADFQALCTREPFHLGAVWQPAPQTQPRVSLSDWPANPQLFDDEDRREEFRRRRQRHSGFVVSSYSRMKQAESGYRPASTADDFSSDGRQVVGNRLEEMELPGGTVSGRFVHEVLEQLPLGSFAAAPSFAAWRAQPDIDTLFRRSMRRYGRDARYLESSQRLVYTGLTTSIEVAAGHVIPGLAGCEPFLREMEFLYPIPEQAHPRLSETPTMPFSIHKGFIKGFVDFLCQYDGLAYFGDWKTDILPNYTRDVLAAHVQQQYTWQAKLYTLALVKMLHMHSEEAYQQRFGGMLYCFLRGMQGATDDGSGVFFARPSWTEILAYETELMQCQAYV